MFWLYFSFSIWVDLLVRVIKRHCMHMIKVPWYHDVYCGHRLCFDKKQDQFCQQQGRNLILFSACRLPSPNILSTDGTIFINITGVWPHVRLTVLLQPCQLCTYPHRKQLKTMKIISSMMAVAAFMSTLSTEKSSFWLLPQPELDILKYWQTGTLSRLTCKRDSVSNRNSIIMPTWCQQSKGLKRRGIS